MAFTKRHYEEVARIIRTRRDLLNTHAAGQRGHDSLMDRCGELDAMQNELRRMFAADNPRFDGTRFDMACEPKEGGK